MILPAIFLVVFITARLVGRRFPPKDHVDWRARYVRVRALCVAWGLLVVLMAISVFLRHDGGLWKKLLLSAYFAVCFGMTFFQFVEARRKMRTQPGFAGEIMHPLTMQLLLQAVLILLPVIGLAGFGLYSLRQDRLLAEQEARESGQILAKRLAQAIGTELVQQLRDYRGASFDLQANRSTDLGLSSWVGGESAESNAWQHIKAWQQANPEIDLMKLPPVDSSSYSETQPEMMPPQPADWLGQLNPEQQQLWQSVKQAEFQAGDFSAAQSAVQTFIASKPPKGARANAEYVLLLAKIHGMAASEAVTQVADFSRSHWGDSAEPTDAGLPVGQLICYQALHRLPDGAGLPENFIRNYSIAWVIQYRASVFSPILIAETERVARGTPQEQYSATLKDWWNANEAARTVFQDFREQHPTNTWKTAPFWVNSRLGNYLLILGDHWVAPTNWVSPSEPRYPYLMLPQAVVEKALVFSVKQSEISLPTYAKVEFDFGEKAIGLSNEPTAETTNSPLPLLGQTDGMLKGLPLNQRSYPFRIRVSLASPEILYARQAQRSRWFGALIIASAAAAVMGLFATWRLFRREQRLNEMKTNFVSSVSHELRAPIASVRLMAENLEGNKIPEPEKQKEYFRFIGQECRRLSSLIENVLDFSRIEQGSKQYEFEPTDLIALTQTTVKLMEPYAAEKGLTLQLTPVPERQPANKLEFEVDGRAIQQALVNLIDNAIKHSARGQTVRLELGQGDHGSVSLAVSDDGPGIPVAEQEKIFERFYRL
ncbi:MAG TPA: HAMP domain-containing sensor histidine kinase, partial [Candidatus Angelobacter sp.]|nr:HAMP domain-containing sensor histidine kinase [Candidatus Angelobacter sp.]